MSKKKNKKKKHWKNPYNKIEFVAKVCNSCGICSYQQEPIFCYQLYRLNPEGFMSKSFRDITQDQYLLNGIWHGNKTTHFKDLFCDNNLCKAYKAGDKMPCADIWACTQDFEEQCGLMETYQEPSVFKKIRGKVATTFGGKNNKASRKAQRRKLPTAEPTFFTSDNKAWKEKIEEILHGNNSIEQDKTD